MSHQRAQVGRAELLRALALGLEGRLTLDVQGSEWFGFEPKPQQIKSAPILQGEPKAEPDSLAAGAVPVSGYRPPLQMDQIWAVVERGASLDGSKPVQGVLSTPIEPIDEKDARAAEGERIVGYQDLLPWARLTPVLRRRLGQTWAAGVDLNALCRQVARYDSVRHLPRQQRSRWHPELIVLLDFSDRLRPYRHDLHQLSRQLLRQCGRSGVSQRVIRDGPNGLWRPWAGERPAGAGLAVPKRWVMPAAGSLLLIAGDLGCLEPTGPWVNEWLRFVRDVQAAGVRVEALAPLGADQLQAPICAALPVIRWSPDSALRPVRAGISDDSLAATNHTLTPGLRELLALVAPMRRVDPPLLRALRQLLPEGGTNAGLEGAVWNHPDVRAGATCQVRAEAAGFWLQHYAVTTPGALKREQQHLRETHHAHLRTALNCEELLLFGARAGDGVLDEPLRAALQRAEKFMRRLVNWLGVLPAADIPAGWRAFAAEAVTCVDAETADRYAEIYTALLACDLRARNVADQQPVALPNWANADRLLNHFPSLPSDIRTHWIVEDVARQQILLQTRPPTLGQRALHAPFEADRVVAILTSSRRQLLLPSQTQEAPLCACADQETVELRAAGMRMVVARVRRPFGLAGWSVSPGGQTPRCWLPMLDGSEAEAPGNIMFHPAEAQDPTAGYNLLTHDWLKWAGLKGDGYGIDRYGVFVDLEVAGTPQRLRHLPPGRFLMGSPATEPGRFDDEGPQHEVTLTRGFWLADTCCTQALWLAVMGGENPSHFTGDPTLPVDSVSWDDVQTFLGRLQEQLPPGVEAVLPTEAQWEYACRAGTQTPFSCGDTLTPEQANFGRNLGKTVPVKSLPANPWGLYEMHGNLWEWCADALRKYGAEPVENPDGGQDGVRRVLRGGAWDDEAGFARSAYRNGGGRGFRFQSFGFRFALRSIEPSAGGGIPGRAEPARVLPQVEPGAGVGPAEPGPRAEGLGARVSAALGRVFKRDK